MTFEELLAHHAAITAQAEHDRQALQIALLTIDKLKTEIAYLKRMRYPSAGTGAASAFQRGSQVGQDSTAVNFLSFDKGNYRYVVYAGDGENGRKGVVVEQSGKRIADLRCQSDAIKPDGFFRLLRRTRFREPYDSVCPLLISSENRVENCAEAWHRTPNCSGVYPARMHRVKPKF